ncbi:hypothetical protein CVT24_004781 [Panaeolus cyanescens]|uniref:Protein kinase domain-containing protein n=1 Tax=Panaeolus cyanescens TaxID=181874 RepID=A0A409V9U6_9AGAR|nr:hypothetical protein CVT24_004781 [Panaeolus cyanescens]
MKDKISDVATLVDDPWLSPKSGFFEDGTPPWLEVSSMDPVPFSQNFSDLFDGLGLHLACMDTGDERVEKRSSSMSYDLKNIANLRDIPDLEHDETNEIVVIPKKRPLTLPTILEERLEGNISCVPTARLSEFEFENNTSQCVSPKRQRIIVHRDTKRRYVVKTRKVMEALWVEHIILEVITDLSLPFLPLMRWSCRDMDQIYMITDLYEGGTLEALLDRYVNLGSQRAQFYAAGISHLHSSGIVHRHLNPKNIYLDRDGHVVISGFDRADFLNQSGVQDKCPIVDDDMIEYSAPELLFSWTHDGRVDCWSFGMLIYYLFFGTHPYQRDMDEYNMTIREVVFSRPVSGDSLRLIHPTARDLILKCLERNPAFRLNIQEVKEQAYFESTNWCRVSSKGLDVPSYHSIDDDTLSISEALRRPMSMIPSFDSDSPGTIPSPIKEGSIKHTGRRSSVFDPPILPELFGPSIPMEPPALPVIEERSTPSDSGTVDDHNSIIEVSGEGLATKKKTPSFWDKLDCEEGASVSAKSLEFGKSTGAPYSCAPKLRKYRSVIHPRFLFNLSTSSFQRRFKKKPKSSGALNPGLSSEVLPSLPNGVHQIGSGIGFSYNMPAKSVTSRASLASFTPSACYTLFHGGFSVRSLGRTLGAPSTQAIRSRVKTKTEPQVLEKINRATEVKRSDDICRSDDFEPYEEKMPEQRQDVGGGTFIREMYRTPSWILVPPENVPSPMSLVNSTFPSVKRVSCSGSTYQRQAACGSPKTESVPLTPATLVNGDSGLGRVPVLLTAADNVDEGDGEVNITISKEVRLAMDLAFPDGSPRPTLRLVPSSATITTQPSFNGMEGLRVSCGGPPLAGMSRPSDIELWNNV